MSTPSSSILAVQGGAASLCPEILHQIFSFTFQDKSSFSTKDPRSQFPWNVAAVCKFWREFCLSTPQLWTRIRAAESWHRCMMWDERCIAPFDVVRCLLQIKRSGSKPLILDAEGSNCRSSHSVIRAVGAQCQRIEALRVEEDSEGFVELMPTQSSFSILEYLDYTIDDCFPGLAYEVLNYRNLPALTALKVRHWSGVMEDSFSDADTFPWRSLSSLYLDSFGGSAASLLFVVQECYDLVELKVSLAWPDDTAEQLDTFDVVIQYQLAHLEIQALPPILKGRDDRSEVVSFLKHFLSYLQAPSLSSISLLEPPSNNQSVLVGIDQAIQRFLSISGRIHSAQLSLWGYDHGLVGIPSYIKELAHVQQLVLRPGQDSECDFLLKAMIEPKPNQFIPFPSLSHLRLIDLKFDPVLLAQLIASRHEADKDVSDSGSSDDDNLRNSETPEANASTITTLESTNTSADGTTPDKDDESSSGSLTRVEVGYHIPRDSERSTRSAYNRPSRLLEAATRAGLADCELDPSFTMTFDPREFVPLSLENYHEWSFDD